MTRKAPYHTECFVFPTELPEKEIFYWYTSFALMWESKAPAELHSGLAGAAGALPSLPIAKLILVCDLQNVLLILVAILPFCLRMQL